MCATFIYKKKTIPSLFEIKDMIICDYNKMLLQILKKTRRKNMQHCKGFQQ